MLADEKKPIDTEVEKSEEVEEIVVDKDIDLSEIRKQRIRIDGDNNRIVELNLSDMGILNRLTESYPKLERLQEKAIKMSENVSGEDFDEVKLGKDLKSLDKEMRNIIDGIFDSKVSDVCVPNGTMFDPHGGMCKYEYVINALVQAYDANITAEAKKINKSGVAKHTKGYTKRK